MRVYKTAEEKAWALMNDPEYFAANCLKIASWGVKGQRGIVPMAYTYLQRRVMDEIAWQVENRNNEIDLIIVKPRKMRCTSVLNGWEYQRITFEEALVVLNIAHSAPVAEEIFDRHIKTFHKFMPKELARTSKTDNKRELAFEENLSKMIVAVAGSNAARGPAASILHLTESGWYNAIMVRDIQQAVYPSVERGPGTARIDESTSGGSGTWQHKRAQAAKDGDSEYRLLFIGCFEVPEYRMTPPKDWEPSPEERAMMKEYGADLEQIYWRHALIRDQYQGEAMLFNMEYPATFDLAFQVAGDRFFHPVKLLMAKGNKTVQATPFDPVVIGIDSAGRGDRTVFVVRQGPVIPHYEVHRNMDQQTVVGIARRLKERFQSQNEYIDMGYGHGAFELARQMGMYSMIGIYPGGKADRKDLYANKRTEMGFRLKKAVEAGPDDVSMFSLPDDKEFYEELSSIPGERIQPGTGLLILPPKDEIKDVLGSNKSPDIFDATSYTYAFDVPSNKIYHQENQIFTQKEPDHFLDTERCFSQFDRKGAMFDNAATIEDGSLGINVIWGEDDD